MVSISQIQASNALIPSTFPTRLVALFVGGTSGIGEITLKEFAQHSHQPRAYFVGRSHAAAERIVAECKVLNPGGEFIFVKADVSLIRIVDEVCMEIKAKEKALNLLFLTQGVMSIDRSRMISLLTSNA
jgi:NADP-dependent 3-hydroxy acid dehydrogenase YdfG